MFTNINLFLIGITALIFSLIFTLPVIKLAIKLNAIDISDIRKVHTKSTPCLGGLSFTLSLIFTCIIFLDLNLELTALLMGLVIILITGMTDDIWHISPIIKFTGEIIASLFFILFSGTVINTFGDLIGTGPIGTGIYAVPISVFCMVGVMNAMNMVDGLDGLAAGISAIACLFLGFFAYTSGQTVYFNILLVLFSSLLGFLYYNRYPAKIFMGDTGSLVLGYILSALCILLVQGKSNEIQVLPVSMAIVMGLPIVDALLVMTIRALNGINPFNPDNSHLHHRILSLGLKHNTTVTIMYGLMLLCGLLAISVEKLPEWFQFYIGFAVALVIFVSIYLLQYLYGNTKIPTKK